MAIGLFGKKLGMTQIFEDSGTIFPVTIIKVESCLISQIKTVNTDGYNAIQVAYLEQDVNKITKPQLGHLKKSTAGTYKGFKSFGEFRITNPQDYELAQELDASCLALGEKVSVTGKSIGKGFAGNQKRHNFSRGPMTHGSKNHRAPGSIGAGTTPGRVYPGKKMAGHLGAKQVTIKKLKVLIVDAENNLIIVKGAVPGKPGNLISIQPYTFSN